MNNLLYQFSLVFFVVVFIGLVVITPVDTILQSQSSGQFWNVIITVAAYCLTVVIAIILYILRLIKTRRSLADIPRRYIPRPDDISPGSASLIESELSRCERIVKETMPSTVNGSVSHAGFLPPEIATESFEGPYEEVVDAMVTFFSRKAVALHSSFGRPRGMAIREYLLLLQSYGIFEEHDAPLIEEFLRMYEYARFSGKPLHKAQFNNFVETCFKVLFAMKPPPSHSQPPDSPQTSSEFNLNLSRTSTADQHRTNRFQNPFLTRPQMSPRLNSSLSRYHSTPLSPFHSIRTEGSVRNELDRIETDVSSSSSSYTSSSSFSADGSVIIRRNS